MNVTSILIFTTDKLLKNCFRIGDSEVPGLDGIPNKALKIVVKSKPGMFAELFTASEGSSLLPGNRISWFCFLRLFHSRKPFRSVVKVP